jgi:hypothetical protein
MTTTPPARDSAPETSNKFPTDDRHRAAAIDPLAPPRSQAFDFDTVCQHLDGEPDGNGMVSREQAAAALVAILEWVCQPAGKRQGVNTAGRRAYAALWLLRPEAFDGAPSQAELCRRLGMSTGYLTAPASEFSAAYGVVSRSQAHGRGGEHRRKLKVDFRPPVEFQVPIAGTQGSPAAPVSPSGETQTPPEAQDAPQGTEEALP